MIEYFEAPDICYIVEDIVKILHDEFRHVETGAIRCVRSYGSKSTAVARIHSLPRIWRYVLGLKPVYIIEVISERFDNLPPSDKIKVLIHELLHIPSRFTGGLRPHGRYVNPRRVMELFDTYMARKNKVADSRE